MLLVAHEKPVAQTERGCIRGLNNYKTCHNIVIIENNNKNN